MLSKTWTGSKQVLTASHHSIGPHHNFKVKGTDLSACNMPPHSGPLKSYQDHTEIEQEDESFVVLEKHAQLQSFSGLEAKPSLFTHRLLFVIGEST